MRRPLLLLVAMTASLCMLVASSASAAALARKPAPARGTGPDSKLRLVLPLVADDTGLASFAQQVSTPGSPLFGQYESISELSQRFGASATTRRRVTDFLMRSGATDIRLDATGLFIDATLTRARAQRLFESSAEREATAHAASGKQPAPKVTIPRALKGAVTGVVGLDTQPIAVAPDFNPSGGAATAPAAGTSGGSTTSTVSSTQAPAPTSPASTTPAPKPGQPSGYQPATGTATGCPGGRSPGGFTPNEYLTAYGFSPLHSQGLTGQGERVALVEIDGFRAKDVLTFAKCFGLRVPRINPFGVGLGHPLTAGGEATLDIEMLDTAAPGLKAIDVYESKPDAASVLTALTDPLQHDGFKPQVISASLGLCESQTVAAVGLSGIKSTEAALEEATASGITVLAASGDSGSADCIDEENGVIEPHKAVNYPASSAWVTSVGGTNVALNSNNTISSQVVWNDTSAQPGDATGGGFSRIFLRPSYQDGTVPQKHRAIPDVSLLSDISPGYDVYCTARPDCLDAKVTRPWQTVGGTSAATPFVAGGFALIDEALRRHKQQSLGLANPLLYRIGRSSVWNPEVFADVTIGSNDVGPYLPKTADSPLGCCSAKPGFDEASGWGGIYLVGFEQIALKAEKPLVKVFMVVPGGQSPYRDDSIKAIVKCTGACDMGVFATVKIGNGKPFTDYSGLVHVPRAEHKLLKVTFKAAQEKRIQAGLAHHDRITATITGAIVDAGGNIEVRTAQKRLTIAH